MDEQQRWWFDDAAGPVVRPYTLTRGRTRTDGIDLDVVTLVVAIQPQVNAARVDDASARLLRVCEHPLSVAEAAAGVGLPLRVVKVLLADLIQQGLILRTLDQPAAAGPDITILREVLHGLRAL
ncbi:DUF742 domain-containing protein [Actinomadura rupiterrae]|uniref:DUF742 domain-containing protein n=1 Tax=Actinomadura rupiterrae TaxID=559627 RepID=UPI0020A3C051|nr:DUF742 domain-containing protein [Actinomadura rupiterrae]MCP2342120.1 hypothetical protein [Actinomadura rupiterrae]